MSTDTQTLDIPKVSAYLEKHLEGFEGPLEVSKFQAGQSNPTFLLRCESNPALYTRCSMLWMGSWSQRSMEALAHMAMDEIPEEELPMAQRPLVVKQMVGLHQRLEPMRLRYLRL